MRHYAGEDPLYFTEKAIDLLLVLKEGDPKEFATYAERAATRSRSAGDGYRARTYYKLLERLHRQIGDRDAALAARHAVAKTWVEDAERRSAKGENMIAHTFMTNAIQAYRGIAGTKDIVSQLHKRLNEFGAKSLDEYQSIETPIDLSKPAENARARKTGLLVEEAIFTFAVIAPLPHPDALRRRVLEIAKRAPLMDLMESTVLDHEGRKVAGVPAMTTDVPNELEKAMQLRIIAQAVDDNQLTVVATIWPAFNVVTEEHFISETEIALFCECSGFVPEGRTEWFIRGLAAGFRSDFVSALSLLIPQVENSLRYLLKKAGVITAKSGRGGH